MTALYLYLKTVPKSTFVVFCR